MTTNETEAVRKQVSKLMAQTFALVEACPRGRVTTYGWIGKALGYPRSARMIGWFMHESKEHVPAQRVINSKGELSGSRAFGQIGRMRQLLEAEGVEFMEDGRVDLKRYGWDPSRDLSDEERQQILEEAIANPVESNARTLNMVLTDPASPFKNENPT
ncbi:MGMT family protein [Dictyobacter aurantiacus]|uniref:Methylated-DNA-[protein]-cysteine S-methyltransferase DNA binding domain-containing protein n=1 Tax=Dictyobacter aurantiacus TaxID=1936993 RepID=A0A401ZN08_9CHLR|nr:MGMT family protein [Dictyobacter aurantiacus]GCE08249.1 hypothetical protein KDAU_55780 [Dictyobacter aurantiacus]